MYYAPFTLGARLRLAHYYAKHRIGLMWPGCMSRHGKLRTYLEAFKLHFFSTRPLRRK